MSKDRVAPLKKITLPRLELLGALIAARIAIRGKGIKVKVFKVKVYLKGIFSNLEKIVLWTDSTIVLHWIQGAASKWKPFVANRVTKIQGMSDPSS